MSSIRIDLKSLLRINDLLKLIGSNSPCQIRRPRLHTWKMNERREEEGVEGEIGRTEETLVLSENNLDREE